MVAIETTSENRERGTVTLVKYPFWVAHGRHNHFRVSVRGSADAEPFTYEVDTFRAVNKSVRAFVTSVAMPGQVVVSMKEIFRKGHTTVSGFTVQVTPLM